MPVAIHRHAEAYADAGAGRVTSPPTKGWWKGGWPGEAPWLRTGGWFARPPGNIKVVGPSAISAGGVPMEPERCGREMALGSLVGQKTGLAGPSVISWQRGRIGGGAGSERREWAATPRYPPLISGLSRFLSRPQAGGKTHLVHWRRTRRRRKKFPSTFGSRPG